MGALSENMKKELAKALMTRSAMFLADGKLLSLEVHDTDSTNEEPDNLHRK